MANEFHLETVVKQDGQLHLDHLPYRAGETVEVTVRSISNENDPTAANPLQATVLRYDNPTEPVAKDEWSATR